MQKIILSCDRCKKEVDHLYKVSLSVDTSKYDNKLLERLLVGEHDEEARFMTKFVEELHGYHARELCIRCSRSILNGLRGWGYFDPVAL